MYIHEECPYSMIDNVHGIGTNLWEAFHMSYHFLLDLALILLSTKLLGLLTRSISLPSVVGSLLAGLLLGPAFLNILHQTSLILKLSELGVIVLMFTAGMEADINELKHSGKSAFVIALLGVIIPLVFGFGVSYFFNRPSLILNDASASLLLQNIFIGVILTATSVSITVETLKELGKITTRSANAILGAAIIDDILGIIALTLITSLRDTSIHVGGVLLQIVLFFLLAGIVGILFYQLYNKWTSRYNEDRRRFVIVAFVLCLIMSYVAEEYFGVADITGAFIAGLIISSTQRKEYIVRRFETLSYLLLSPIFFASIGLKVVIPTMTTSLVLFTVILLLVAILSKIVGCGLGARMCGYNRQESLQIGSGMVSRGEVALIVASKGASVGLMSSVIFGPVVIMVILTTVIAPILLKLAFQKDSTSKNI